MTVRGIAKIYSKGSVCLTGNRGAGKDMLQANVIARRKLPYVSNFDYKCKTAQYYPLDFNELKCGGNTYVDLINGTVKKFRYAYPERADIYISDGGVYLPAQYCNELNRDYKTLPTFFSLSRHICNASVHANTQHLARLWDKLREQLADTYIRCNWCKVFFRGKLVIQKVTIYDKYQSCLDRVKPYRDTRPLFAHGESKATYSVNRENYRVAHGEVKSKILIYINKSNYNTRFFKELLCIQD